MGTFSKIIDMYSPAFKKLLQLSSFTAKEAQAYGVDPHILPYYVKKGFFERVTRGVYRNLCIPNTAPFEWQDLLETS